MQDLIDSIGDRLGDDGSRTIGPSWKEVDYDLEELPTPLCNVGNDLLIEWVYLIDLDRLLFVVNNWIFFDLWNIPQDSWELGFKAGEDDSGDYNTFDFGICPEAFIDIKPPECSDSNNPPNHEEYISLSQEFGFSEVNAVSDVNVFSSVAPPKIFGMLAFDTLTTLTWSMHFWKYLRTWCHEDFAFREVAFAILSFAAGKFYFHDRCQSYGSVDRHLSDGFLVTRDKNGGLELMPSFGSAYHLPHESPGSAPISTMYWFEDVLISLVSDASYKKDMEVCIGKVVKEGLEQGRETFQAMLFSISNFLLLEVNAREGVKTIRRTGVISLVNLSELSGFEEHSSNSIEISNDTQRMTPLQLLFRQHPGFSSLQNFFSASSMRKVATSTQGIFPNEIYTKIFAYASPSTQTICAEVSELFQELHHAAFTFHKNLSIINFKVAKEQPCNQYVKHLNDFVNFTGRTHDSGQLVHSARRVDRPNRIKDQQVWNPVIGSGKRLSLMDQIELDFSLVSVEAEAEVTDKS